MGELPVMEVEAGEIKAFHSETTVHSMQASFKAQTKACRHKKALSSFFSETASQKMRDIAKGLSNSRITLKETNKV